MNNVISNVVEHAKNTQGVERTVHTDTELF